MEIAYITSYDVLDSSNWPKQHRGLYGAGYNISQALEVQSVSIDYLGPLVRKRSPITRAKWLWYRHLFKKDYYSWAEPLVLKDYARQISHKLSQSRADIVFCPENAVLIAHLKSQRPVVLWTDATITSLVDFYPYLSNLCQETIGHLHEMEKRALENCRLAIYTSEWAAKAAIDLYKIDPDKVKVIPWGPNLDCDRSSDDIHRIVESRVTRPCKLLFLGFDWSRKGGDIALEVAEKLNNSGLGTELILVGAKPDGSKSLPEFVKQVGIIDKASREGKEQLDRILETSHFLILPTKAETFGHVFCEANSFGVPCITTDVGGISTVVKDGLNGKKFSLTADISEYCQYITSLMNSYDEYKKLALSSFEEYQSRLNWFVSCKTLKNLLMEI